jgi:hypothetical protein
MQLPVSWLRDARFSGLTTKGVPLRSAVVFFAFCSAAKTTDHSTISAPANRTTCATFVALLPALFRLKLSVGSRVGTNLSVNPYPARLRVSTGVLILIVAFTTRPEDSGSSDSRTSHARVECNLLSSQNIASEKSLFFAEFLCETCPSCGELWKTVWICTKLLLDAQDKVQCVLANVGETFRDDRFIIECSCMDS